MKISEQQAVDYLEAAREFSSLASLLLRQATDDKEKLHNKIETKCADALYWAWLLTTEYLSEEKVKKYLEKNEEK